MTTKHFDHERLAGLDRRVVAASRGIKVLSHLGWSADLGPRFLETWKAGRPELPRPEYAPIDLSESARELEAVMDACDRDHPLEDFVYRTARSYLQATSLIAAIGTPAFGERSRAIYGDPSQPITGELASTVTAARHVMDATAPFVKDCGLDEDDYCVVPAAVAAEMTKQAAKFDRDPVEVVVDPALSSKAAAGAKRVRLRGGTCYSDADIPQLVHHELFVHTLTALNGRLQPVLTCLSLGAPRTTRTQEGLALFAELITNSMDVNRLRRIAARAVAIDMALGGADFIEVFDYFRSVRQTPNESFSSAQRVFRGTDARGGAAFTKDGVYFQGLVRIHRFLRDAAREGRVDDPTRLMAGRVHARDVARLEPWFRSGDIVAPRYLPDWVGTRSRLVAFLLYSSFAAELHLDSLMEPAEAAASDD